jgi:adenosine kinase
VDRYRGEFLELMRSGTVDLVFANEAELHSLYQTSDFDTALAQLRGDAKLGVVTRSEKGCVVASSDGVIAVPAFPIREAGGHHRRRRPVRRRIPVRAGAQCRS